MHIEVGPVYSCLKGVPKNIVDKIDNGLACLIPGIQYSRKYQALRGRWDGKFHFLSKGSNRFPTGLLDKVLEIEELEINQPYTLSLVGDMIKGINNLKDLRLNDIELSSFQRESVENGIMKMRGNYYLATNAGKSEICIALQRCFDLPALWLVDKKDLLYQCTDRYKTRTGFESGIIGDGHYSPSNGMNVAMVQTLIRLQPKQLQQFLDTIKILLVDEAPHAQSHTWYKICMSCPAPFRYGLTGSPPTERLKLYRMMAATDSRILYEKKNSELIEEGWSAFPNIHLQPLNYQENSLSYKRAYDTMIRFNKKFASIVSAEAARWYEENKIVLILVERISQGSNVLAELKGRNIPCVFLHGEQEGYYRKENIDKFRKGQIPVMIATSILKEGVDIPAINVLILAAGGLSMGQQLQRIGRALRKKQDINETDIVDYCFNGNFFLLKHSLARVDIYENEGFKINWREAIEVK